MIRFIFRTDHTDRGITFWQESRDSGDLHVVPRAERTRWASWWRRNDNSKPVSARSSSDAKTPTRHVGMGFRGSENG